jgi:hypothetical protein
MPEHMLFERMFELGEQLKGGPLTDPEKQEMGEAFHHAGGSAFERAIAALSSVLSTKSSDILKRGRAMDKEDHLMEKLSKAAEAWEREH